MGFDWEDVGDSFAVGWLPIRASENRKIEFTRLPVSASEVHYFEAYFFLFMILENGLPSELSFVSISNSPPSLYS